MKRKELSVAIIGGGIGGMAAALSLLRSGADVHVYERAKQLSEVGAGIQVSPNASRILHGLGLARALSNMGDMSGLDGAGQIGMPLIVVGQVVTWTLWQHPPAAWIGFCRILVGVG